MADLLDLLGDLEHQELALRKLENDFPMIIGVECTKQIRNNFKIQGYYVSGQWQHRAASTNFLYDYNRTSAYRTPVLGKVSKHRNPYKGSVVSSRRPILTQTGNLRDSITYKVQGTGVEIGVFSRTVNIDGKLHEALSYCKLLNEGGSMQAWNHSAKMPRRQFMPFPNDNPSPQMLAAIEKKYIYEQDKIFHKWKV